MTSGSIPIEALIFTRAMRVAGDRAKLYRAVRAGELTAVTRGVYVATALWSSAYPEGRHRAAITAVDALRSGLVFGSTSAAVLWGRPLLHSIPAKPIAIRSTASGGRSDANVTVRETLTPFEPVSVGGVFATSLARSLVDAARALPLGPAVGALDHALSHPASSETWPTSDRVSLEELLAEIDRGTHVGRGRARVAIAFANGESGSPGESLSRVIISTCGLSAPVLQQAFYDAEGLIGYVDFWWPELGIIGEFDGNGKYLREEFARGRTQAEVIADEKRREDRLRALGYIVVRWEWSDLMRPHRLREKLRRAGVR